MMSIPEQFSRYYELSEAMEQTRLVLLA